MPVAASAFALFELEFLAQVISFLPMREVLYRVYVLYG